MTKVAVVLAGCGVFDGAEIYESVLTLLNLDTRGVDYQCFAPDMEQMHVINHLSGEVAEGESRNVLVEAARITRGNIKNLNEAQAADFDAMIVPGGFGVAKNLSDFAVKGSECSIQADLMKFAQAMKTAGKPVGLICIAPTMAAKIFGEGVECTIGNDAETATAIESMGGKHISCPVTQCHVDKQHKLVTTPAYMLAEKITEAAEGINRLVHEILEMA